MVKKNELNKQSIFNSNKELLTPEEWEKKKQEIIEKADAYDEKHELTVDDEHKIQEFLEDLERKDTPTFKK